VAIAAKFTYGDTHTYVPVATLDVYLRFWMPGIEAEGLQRLEACESMGEFDLPGFEGLSDELLRLRAWIDRHDAPHADAIVARIDRLLVEIEAASAYPDAHISIG